MKQDQVVKNAFETEHRNQNLPLITQTQQIISCQIQPLFSFLMKISEYTNFIWDKNKNDYDESYIENNSKNSYDNSIETFLDSYLKYGLWSVNSVKNLQDIKDIKEKLYKTTLLNPILKTVFESVNVNEQIIERILIIHPSDELLYQYPLYKDSSFDSSNYRGWCKRNDKDKNKEGEYPSYYYFQCEPWYQDTMKIFNEMDKDISISYPFTLKSDNIGVTMCLKKEVKNKEDKEDLIYFCFEVAIVNFRIKLEMLNNALSGFFFLSRVKTKILIYYPNEYRSTFEDYSYNEFGDNTTFFLDEINEYNGNTKNIFEVYDPESSTGTYIKNGKTWKYNIYPIYFTGPSGPANLLNLVYSEEENYMDETISSLLTVDIQIFFIPIIYFVIQGILLNLLSKFLVYSIAANIVLPMKNIKKILEKMNIEDNIVNEEEEEKKKNASSEDQDANEEEGTNDSQANIENDALIEGPQNSNEDSASQKSDDDEDDSHSNEGDSDEEEEYINIRSRDIQDLFCRLINVRNSLNTVNTDSDKVTTRLLPDMLFATEKFGQIKNATAFNICNSNVGKLLIDCQKYDIAIMHLMESDTFTQAEKSEYMVKIADISSAMNKKRGASRKNIQSALNKSGYSANQNSMTGGNNNTPQRSISNEADKNKKLIESRYPKLIHAFKQFFKNLSRLEKLKQHHFANKTLTKTIITEIELYSTKRMHMLVNFQKVLDNYVFLTQPLISKSNVKHINALFEKIAFSLKYEIIPNKATSQNFQEMHELFIKIKELIKMNKDTNKPKNILKVLIKESDQIGTIDTPNEILKQKLNYFQGQLAYKSFHFLQALKYYMKVTYKNGTSISDANIVKKSFNKIVKISKIYYKRFENLKKTQEMTLLKNFITMKVNEASKFKTVFKDYIILISSYNKPDFIKSALEKARNIIDNFITPDDRFCLSFASEEVKIITKMQIKKETRGDLLYDFIQSIMTDKKLITNSSEEGEENLELIIKKAKSYLMKKNVNGERREVFYIYITSSIEEKSVDFLCGEEVLGLIGKNESLLLVVHEDPREEYANDGTRRYKIKLLNSNLAKMNKSDIISFNDISPMKKKLNMYGEINNFHQFSLETYQP